MCQITSLLDGREVSRLWVACDSTLRSNLSRGGLQSLSYHTVGCTHHDISWPSRLLKQFPRLDTVSISRTRGVATARQIRSITYSDIEVLPRNLRKLDLSNFYYTWLPTSSSDIPKLLSALPQSLIWLALPDMTLREEHLSLIPPNLGYLQLQSILQPASIAKFSANLETLKITLRNLHWSVTLADWPRALHTLEINGQDSSPEIIATELDDLPPHLTSLTLNVPMVITSTRLSSLRRSSLVSLRLPMATVVRDVESNERTISLPDDIVSIGFKSCDEDCLTEIINALPNNLTYFGLESATNMTPALLKLLPASLTSLRLRHAEQLPPNVWRHLPPHLVNLVFRNHNDIFARHLAFLPRTLISIDTGRMNADYWVLMRHPSLPPNLRYWTAKTLTRNQEYGTLLPYINIREKPTFLRRLGYAISTLTPWSVLVLASQSALAYYMWRQSNRILPAIPSRTTSILRRGTLGWMSWVLAFYWALR